MRWRGLIFSISVAVTLALGGGWISSYRHLLSISEWRSGVVYIVIIGQGEICCEYQSPGPPYSGPPQLLWGLMPVDEEMEKGLAHGYHRANFHALGFVAGKGRVSFYVWTPIWFFFVASMLGNWFLWKRLRKPSLRAFAVQESPDAVDQQENLGAAHACMPRREPL